MITKEERQDLLEDDEYPMVVHGERYEPEEPLGRALDNVYKVISDEIEDETFLETLAEVPAGYVRGTPSEKDVRWILDDIEGLCSGNDKIVEAVEESRNLINR